MPPPFQHQQAVLHDVNFHHRGVSRPAGSHGVLRQKSNAGSAGKEAPGTSEPFIAHQRLSGHRALVPISNPGGFDAGEWDGTVFSMTTTSRVRWQTTPLLPLPVEDKRKPSLDKAVRLDL